MAITVILCEKVVGFDQQHGWFFRKCVHYGEKTKERIRHKFPWCNPDYAYWVKESAHFQCHRTECWQAFCREHAFSVKSSSLVKLKNIA